MRYSPHNLRFKRRINHVEGRNSNWRVLSRRRSNLQTCLFYHIHCENRHEAVELADIPQQGTKQHDEGRLEYHHNCNAIWPLSVGSITNEWYSDRKGRFLVSSCCNLPSCLLCHVPSKQKTTMIMSKGEKILNVLSTSTPNVCSCDKPV